MPDLKGVTNLWNNIREVDLRPLQEQATRDLQIAIAGRRGSGKRSLAEQMRTDPSRPNMTTEEHAIIIEIEESSDAPALAAQMEHPDLILLVVGWQQVGDALERRLAKYWSDTGQNVLVALNTGERLDRVGADEARALSSPFWGAWEPRRLVIGHVESEQFLMEILVPAVLGLLPERHLSLGRHYPLFRIPLARQMINETSAANAAYSLGTGIAETVPALGLPLNVADMVVLTKAQAFLVYKLGLLLGLSTRWQDYVTEFGGVLGGSFFWRQMARQLVGLIPVWGIIPKVSVAYAGTYVVGNVVLQWYLTGRHVTKHQMRQLYQGAYRRGKDLARDLVRRAPRPRLRGRREKVPLASRQANKACPSCGKLSAADASYCQYCGEQFPPGIPDI